MNKVTTQLRLDDDVHIRVRCIARIERRSKNAQLERFIEKAVQKYIEENGPLPIIEEDYA